MAQVTSAPAPYRFTREEYHRMGEAGIFDGKRVELLDGAIITMSPQKSLHAATVDTAQEAIRRAVGAGFRVRAQLPIVLDDWSEPEPDIALCRPDPHGYARGHPRARDVLLAVEVAESSLAYDRNEKAAAYAASGIPAYWLVSLPDRRVEVMTEPDRSGRRYTRTEVRTENDILSLPNDATVRVAELLPPL